MERRKEEILKNFENVVAEKNTIITNLNNVTKELENSIEIMKVTSPEDLKRTRHLLNIQKFQLSFLKALSEISFTLDILLEEEELPSVTFTKSVSVGSVSARSSLCESNDTGRMDISTLKEHVQQLSEKIQTSCPAVQNYVSNYYKTSTGCTRNDSIRSDFFLSMPSTSVTFESGFELPEKDTSKSSSINPPANVPSINNCSGRQSSEHNSVQVVNNHSIEKSNIEVRTHMLIDLSDPLQEAAAQPVALAQMRCNFKTIESTIESLPYPLSDSCSDPEIIEILEESSVVSYETGESSSSDTTSTVISEVCGSSSQPLGLTANSSIKQETRFTALDKLNNRVVLDRRQEALDLLVDSHNIPDISLKPLLEENSNVYKNSFKGQKKSNSKNCGLPERFMSDDVELLDFITPKEGQECVFSHVESPSEFYVQMLNKDIEQIDLISDQIDVYYKNSSPLYKTKNTAKALTSRFCVAYLKDKWYRVEVLNWFMDDSLRTDDVFIQLVDFGSTHKVSYKWLRKMPMEVTHIRKLAVRCHLVSLYPPSSTYDNLLTEWPPESVEALANLSGIYIQNHLNNDSEFKFYRIEYADKIGDSIAIDLISENEDGDTVGQILLDLNLAVQLLEAGYDEDQTVTTFLADLNELEESDTLTEAVQGYDARDEARVCRFSRRGQPCFKGEKCLFEHIDISKDGYTTDKVFVHMEALTVMQLPEIGTEIMIIVTGFIDICRYYVQIIRDPVNTNFYLVDKCLYDLIELMNNMDLTKTYSHFKIWPAIGEIVIAKHWASKKWLRAKIRHLIMNAEGVPESVQVFTVDFGEIFDVPLANVRQMNEDFLHLPFQAIECYMHDVQQAKSVDSETARNFFLEHMLYRNFKSTVLSGGPILKLTICTFKDVCISNTLLRLNLAEERTTDDNQAEGCKVQAG